MTEVLFFFAGAFVAFSTIVIFSLRKECKELKELLKKKDGSNA
jgi:hypothetical protein